MKDYSKLILDSKKGKIFFKGNCLEVLDICEATCCKHAMVTLSQEGIRSNFFKMEAFCIVTNGECKDTRIDCVNREYRLKRKKDGSCIYLTRDNGCSIHNKKPQNCRDFDCRGGWRLNFSTEQLSGKPEVIKRVDKEFIEKLKDNMVFIINPLMKIKTLFYVRRKKEITFVNKRIEKCGFVSKKYKFDNPRMDDEALFYLIGLFEGKNTLKDVRQKVNRKYNLNLSKKDFYKIICFLHRNKIIIFKNPVHILANQ